MFNEIFHHVGFQPVISPNDFCWQSIVISPWSVMEIGRFKIDLNGGLGLAC